MKVLLFMGAGSSVELGVPAMVEMARAFRRHVSDWHDEARFVEELMGGGLDLEDLIEKLDPICAASGSLRALGHDEVVFEQARSVQAEVEWFVQHTCERLMPELAILQWGPLLRLGKQHDLIIATTNYDRAIELAANSVNQQVEDGFDQFANNEIAHWRGLRDSCAFGPGDSVRLLKLHGSTDWYELASSDEPVKLRHPMPLFANARLHVPSINDELRASLILPAREKRVTRPPYVRLNQAFLNATDQCDVALFLGTSLRDVHIRQAAVESSARRPTFVINRSPANDMAPSMPMIIQPASHFLISTLPNALVSDDPISLLKQASECSDAESSSKTEGILTILRVILDDTSPDFERCTGIERLEALGVSLEVQMLEQLLTGASNMVARFALGLIPLSINREHLLKTATGRPDAQEDLEFQDELELLRKLLAIQDGD